MAQARVSTHGRHNADGTYECAYCDHPIERAKWLTHDLDPSHVRRVDERVARALARIRQPA